MDTTTTLNTSNLESNKIKRTTSQSKKYCTRKLSSTLIKNNQSNDKRQNLMKVIIATAQAAAVCAAVASDNDSSTHSNHLLFNNLVRIKQFHHVKSSTNPNQFRVKKNKKNNNNKKKKTSFRIEKTYRFNRISRLRCFRLRQTQLKEKRSNQKKKNLKKNNKKFKKSFDVNSSCAESTDSKSTTNQTNTSCSYKTTSSSSSSNEDTLSLVECFKQTKFLNSSDTREEEDESKRDQLTKKKMNCIKPKKISFKKKLHRLGYLNLKKTQLFCDCHYCNYKPMTKTTVDKLNKIYLKRKRLIKQDEIEAKKLKCDSCLSPSLSSIQSSGEDNTSKDDLINSTIKSDDTNDESEALFDLKNKLKNNRFKSKSFSEEDKATTTTTTSTGLSSDLKQCSSEDDLDDTGADDEQSDWPGNENLSNKLKQKLNTSTSVNQIDDDDSFKVVEWWNEMDQDYERNEQLLRHNKLIKTNYDRVNMNEESDNSEFDSILNGALSMMSASSRKAYKMKMKLKQHNNKNKLRSSSLDQDYISTKSFVDLDPLVAKPINEDNKGNQMLQQMGWKPGTSLGLNQSKSNLINPIIAVKRPHRVGLGFNQQ